MKLTSVLSVVLICIPALSMPASANAAGQDEQETRGILNATAVKGGLVVHVGCGDGRLTAAFCANNSYIVHGLDKDASNVKKAREYIHSVNLYGKVSAERLEGDKLPYIDNLVNLVVAEDLGDIPMTEVMRVLAPKGVAYIKQAGKWQKTIKPRPDDIDEWTH